MPLPEKPEEESVYDIPPAFSPFDPETVQPTFRPDPSSSAPGTGSTSGADGTQAEPGTEEPPLPQFDPRWREEFTGLLYIGALTSNFEWLGHQFVIRTLTTQVLAEVALAVKIYDGSGAEDKAWQGATIAGAVISVDGKALPIPITNEPGDTEFLTRFRYVMSHWYPPVLDAVYERYIELELKVREVVAAMGNPSG